MKKDYVVCKGKTFKSGDVMDILWYTNGYYNKRKHTGIFLDCDEEKDEYRFVVDGVTYCYNHFLFYRTVYNEAAQAQNTNNANHTTINKKLAFKDELNIDGLLLAWIWYVFIMVVAVIFVDRIGIWALASIIFFNYRNKKLKEAGYK